MIKTIIFGIILTFSIMIITSCNDKRENLIKEYERNFKIDIEGVSDYTPIYAKDSLDYWNFHYKFYDGEFKKFSKKFYICLNKYKKTHKEIYGDSCDFYIFECEYYQPLLATARENTSLYSNDSSRILNNRFIATYSVNNPFLNNTIQTITKIYTISPNGDILYSVNCNEK
jgi:hypothetical protein